MSDTSPIRLAWRIFVQTYERDDSFAGLQEFLLAHRPVVDEVAFFETETHHLFLPLELFAGRAAVLARRLAALRAAGIPSVGINVLCTLGHVNEAWDCLPPLPFQPLVGHDGALSKGCACPNGEDFRAYILEKYRLMAAAGPDFIWVDDDIRLHHHGVQYACFCPRCLEIFAGRTGTRWEREALAAALDRDEEAPLRRAWVEQHRETLTALLAAIAWAIHAVDPRIVTGLMTAGPGWSSYSGFALDRWCAALGATKARPGGGYYSDRRPGEVVEKMLDAGRQLAALPAAVADRQYELENYPYCRLDKSAASVVNECALAVAVGMNGIAFNALGNMHGGELAERAPLLEAISRHRGYWETLARAAGDLPLRGVWPAWHAALAERRRLDGRVSWWDFDGRYDFNRALGLAELGLPLCTTRAAADAVVLAGRLPDLFSDEELREMLSGALLLDGTALDALHQRGLGELAGARVAARVDNGVRERFTSDLLNGGHAGHLRYVNLEFWGDACGSAARLEPLAPETRVLGELVNYAGALLGPCMTVHENALGGRVAVAGFAPWSFLGSSAKRDQLLQVADWLLRGRLPLRIAPAARLVPWLRLSNDRTRGLLLLFNAGLDPLETLTLTLALPRTPLALARPGEPVAPLDPTWTAAGCEIALPAVPAWSTVALLLGEEL